jgi:hypothetical protein
MRFLYRLPILLLLAGSTVRAADSLPAQLSDNAFWNLFIGLSEPGGVFSGENYVSNEGRYANLLAELQRTSKPGGVYIGVGPEQNFNYIAGLRPKFAFILDIRRQNALEHLMYKALFELSPDRATFLSGLFSRERPPGLSEASTARELMTAFSSIPANTTAYERVRLEVRNKIERDHGFPLSSEDFDTIAEILKVFSEHGAATSFLVGNPVLPRTGPNLLTPTYAGLMEATGSDGNVKSYLGTEESYRFIRDMEVKGTIVPVVGDFGGDKSLRAIGQFVRDHDARITHFYVSNVEPLLFPTPIPNATRAVNGGWSNYAASLMTLPIDETSIFLRYIPAPTLGGRIDRIQETIQAVREGRLKTADDLIRGTR